MTSSTKTKPANSILDFSLEESTKLEKRFWSRVAKTEGCWLWKGAKIWGYGVFAIWIDGQTKNFRAHRVPYELANGRIPNGFEPDHLCRNRACVNPEHIEIVTHRENDIRGVGAPAMNTRKNYCPRGHPLVEGNLVPSVLKKGHRACWTCRREQWRIGRANHEAKKKAKGIARA